MNLLEGEALMEEEIERVGAKENNDNTRKANEGEGRDETEESTMDLNGPLTDEEIWKTVKRIKNGEAAGEDGITANFFRNLLREGQRELVETVKELWSKEKVVKSWRMARIFPIHKNGDTQSVKSYRGVSLLDIGYKILATVMAKRLSSWLEKEGKLLEGQAGFRKGRSTMEQVFVLNTITGNRLKRKGRKLHVAFVDFAAAFDKVNRKTLWKKMGIEGRFLNMLKEIYRSTWCEGITTDGMRDGFRTTRG